jgi:hypothetical protein
MIVKSEIDAKAKDGSIHRLRVVWAEEAHTSSGGAAGVVDQWIWRALRVIDADTGEELERMAGNRFVSKAKGEIFTVGPEKTAPGSHP